MKSWTVCFRSTSVSPFVISPRWLLVPFDLFYWRGSCVSNFSNHFM
ncbi:unnamed protein product [Brassica rapa subsp. trilocularis]